MDATYYNRWRRHRPRRRAGLLLWFWPLCLIDGIFPCRTLAWIHRPCRPRFVVRNCRQCHGRQRYYAVQCAAVNQRYNAVWIDSRNETSSIDNAFVPSPSNNHEDQVFPFIFTDETVASPNESFTQLQDSATEAQRVAYRPVMLALIWMVAVLSALDRVAMSVAIVPMAAEFDWTETIQGAVSSWLSAGYAILILPAGLALSVMSPRLIMGAGLAAWSVATILTPAAASLSLDTLTPLLLVRAAVGAAESVVIPAVQRFLASWTLPHEKSTALATIFTGFHLGTILAYSASPYVMDTLWPELGWRALFVAYGAAGLLTLLPWALLAKDSPRELAQQQQPELFTSLSQDNGQYTTLFDHTTRWSDALVTLQQAPWSKFAKSRSVWAVLLAHCSKNWGLYNSLAWTPTFYASYYGVSIRDAALLSVLPSVAGAAGGFVAGQLADGALKHRMATVVGPSDDTSRQLTLVRKTFQSVGLLGPALALGALAVTMPSTDATTAQAYLMLSTGLMGFNAAGFESGCQDLAGPRWTGLLYAATSLPAVLVGTAAVYVTGVMLDVWTHNEWSVVFATNAAVNVLGTLAFVSLYQGKREFD